MKSNKIHFFLLTLASGILLSLAWPARGFPGLLFIGFVPLLFLEDLLYRNRESDTKFSALIWSWPGFLIWNILTTWWIVNSTTIGGIMAITLNSLFMSIVFQAFHWSRKKFQHAGAGYAALISYWTAFEYLHLNWDLNWPWLNLGNGFASFHPWIQWYEYTGTIGGTLWTLIGNILIFELISHLKNNKSKVKKPLRYSFSNIQYSIFIFIWILAPILFSYVIYTNYEEKKHPVNFVVVQPNIDPYSEQYSLPPAEVIGRIMKLAAPYLDTSSNFLVGPESTIQENLWENGLSGFSSIRDLNHILENYPDLNILVGASTFYQFMPGEPLPRTARKFTDTPNHYNAYNTAILINKLDSHQLYHKSKLTPGVEILPSFSGFKWLENYAIDLGGTVGSLGTDSVRRVYNTVKTVKVAPAICYESVFGEFFASFVNNGAQIMIIITNDGWWGNTPGYKQHFLFAHLRAIETRRCIARSANTGISAFINQRGDASSVTEYWEPAAIKGTLNANQKITFYVKHGDYLARIFSWAAGAIFFISLILAITNRIKKSRLSIKKH